MLKEALLKSKLKRTEARMKKLHGLQKRNRKHIQQLLQQRNEMEREKYESQKAKLEATKHDLIQRLSVLEEQERQLRAQIDGAQGAKAKAKA